VICALCGHEGNYLGGRASDKSGTFDLCHRDHSNGRTCYEQATFRFIGETFAQTIERLKNPQKPIKAYKISAPAPVFNEFDLVIAQEIAESLGEPFIETFNRNMEVLGYNDLKIKSD